MLKVALGRGGRSALKLLCLGAHSDDLEIGCGGTILRMLEEAPETEVYWVVLGATGQRESEALESARLFLGAARRKEVVIKGFKDGFFPYVGMELKLFFEELKSLCFPDVILTHYRGDLHQDHRLVSDLTWNTFRDHFILEYEIVKYDGDLGSPNFFTHLDAVTCRRKVEYIMQCFGSQKGKAWFSDESFSAVMRIRGVECNAPGKYAEGFYSRKAAF